MKIKIRQASINDVSLLQDLNHRIMVNNPRFDPEINPDWEKTEYGRQFFTDRCINQKWYTIIAEVDGEPVGYLNGEIDNFGYRQEAAQKVAVIENVGVLPEYQGRGVGHQLMANFKAWAKGQQIKQIQLTCFAKNDHALEWYKKLGFLPSDVIMQTSLQGDSS